MALSTPHDNEDPSPEERRKFLEEHGAQFVDALQLQALGEHLKRERARAQKVLEDQEAKSIS